jgi:hypothetical protein
LDKLFKEKMEIIAPAPAAPTPPSSVVAPNPEPAVAIQPKKSLDKLSKDEMRSKIKEFSTLLKSQREHWDKESKIGFTYSCDLISQSLITLYIRLGRD